MSGNGLIILLQDITEGVDRASGRRATWPGMVEAFASGNLTHVHTMCRRKCDR